jgi:hypothetical protein
VAPPTSFEREVYHLFSSGAEVKNMRNYTSIPPYVLMALFLIKHGYNLSLEIRERLWRMAV